MISGGPEFQEKFVAFMDILGFRSKVESAERDKRISLADIISLCSKLEQPSHVQAIREYGPTVCPESRCTNQDLDYVVTQISDCAIISAEVSPAGLINLLHHVSASVFSLLTDGIMVRGYVSRGNIYHRRDQFFGTGYQNAYDKEDKVQAFRLSPDVSSTPFVEVDSTVVDYVKTQADQCVREVFKRFSKEDESGIVVIYPFQHLSGVLEGTISDTGNFERKLNIVKGWIVKFIEKLESNSPQNDIMANQKAKYYRQFLLEELEACQALEKELARLREPAVKVLHLGDIV